MSISPIGGAILVPGGGSPAATIRGLLALLREQRQGQLEAEECAAAAAVAAARDRAAHAQDRAAAMRGQAWLRFGVAAGGTKSAAPGGHASASSPGPAPSRAQQEPLAIIVAPDRGVAPLEVVALLIGGRPGAQCVWDFGDGNSARGQSVTHRYWSPGAYTIKATADGQTATAEVVVEDAPER